MVLPTCERLRQGDLNPAGGAAPAAKDLLPEPPCILSITLDWHEGKTMEDQMLLKEVQTTGLAVDGVIGFQYSINEELKKCYVTETYRDGAAMAALLASPLKELQPKMFALNDTTSIMCAGPKAVCDVVGPGLKDFKGVEFFYTDGLGCACCKAGEGVSAEAPVTLSIGLEWNEGKTMADQKALLPKVMETAMAVPGVSCFQYAANEETKKSFVTETYSGPAAMGALLESPLKELKPKMFELNKTTSIIATGPKAAVDAIAPGLAEFPGVVLLYTDALGSATKNVCK